MYRLPVYEGVVSARAQEESENAKKRSPAKALRDNSQTTVVNDVSALGGYVDVKN